MNKQRGFEVVAPFARKTIGDVKLPVMGSKFAMASDFFANQDYTVNPGEVVKIWTDIKAYMGPNEALLINVRSSMGGKFMLANTQGWIDADYYQNPDNDGNIGVFLKNISNVVQTIHRGDRIAQGAFIPFLCPDTGASDHVRTGGFGSTGI